MLGTAAAVVIVIGWLLSRWHGADYAFGTSSVPTQIWSWLFDGSDNNMWIPVGLLSDTLGALVAAVATKSLWVRGETATRYAQLGVGGLLMGVSAGIAGGCNLGHAMVGVPLLSLGSIVSTMAIVVGVFISHHVVKAVTS